MHICGVWEAEGDGCVLSYDNVESLTRFVFVLLAYRTFFFTPLL